MLIYSNNFHNYYCVILLYLLTYFVYPCKHKLKTQAEDADGHPAQPGRKLLPLPAAPAGFPSASSAIFPLDARHTKKEAVLQQPLNFSNMKLFIKDGISCRKHSSLPPLQIARSLYFAPFLQGFTIKKLISNATI